MTLRTLREKNAWNHLNRKTVQEELAWAIPVWAFFILVNQPILAPAVVFGGRLIWESYKIKKEYE